MRKISLESVSLENPKTVEFPKCDPSDWKFPTFWAENKMARKFLLRKFPKNCSCFARLPSCLEIQINLSGPSIDWFFFLTSQIWNLDTMLPMQTLSRHEGSVNCVVIHKDLLLSGSEDMEIKVCFIAIKGQKRNLFSSFTRTTLTSPFKSEP